MSADLSARLYLPALRGHMGDWGYYSCLMPLGEVASRVKYADELHPKTERKSDLLQRSLNRGRGKEIAEYLANEDARFFNALVIAVYGGDPEWHEFGNITPQHPDIRIEDISQSARESLGFLSFSGRERLFALDGQHRLAGIKLACNDNESLAEEEVAVVFVAHKNTALGLQRTRRLFTTLNKRAKPVSKGEIITLDEDDAMAICVRRLVEEHDYFSGERIAYSTTNNIPQGNTKCLTTIGNLYDILKTLFTRVTSRVQKKPKEVLYYRPTDETLDELFGFASEFFELMARHFKPLGEFFSARQYQHVVAKYRGDFGGNLLFRPLGLSIITRVIAVTSKEYSLQDAVKYASWLPQELNAPPYADIVWDTNRKAMNKPPNEVLMRRLCLYMLGFEVDESELSSAYAIAIGDRAATDRFKKDVTKVVR